MVTTQPGISRSPRHGVSSARSAHRNETVWRSLRGMAQEAALFDALGRELANTRAWPQWKDGAEFKAEREKTRDARR